MTTACGPLTAAMSTCPEISSGAACTAIIAPPAGSACISAPRAPDQRAGVLQREHPGHVRGGDLTDRMPGQEVRPQAPRLRQPVEGDLEGEQRGLGDLGLVQPRPPDAMTSAMSNCAQTASNAPANTGNAACSSRPIPARWAPCPVNRNAVRPPGRTTPSATPRAERPSASASRPAINPSRSPATTTARCSRLDRAVARDNPTSRGSNPC